jgi:hypothetical protein
MCIPRLINLHSLPTPYDTSGITCIMKWSNSQEIGQQNYISENQQLIYIISTWHSFTITSKMLFDIRQTQDNSLSYRKYSIFAYGVP